MKTARVFTSRLSHWLQHLSVTAVAHARKQVEEFREQYDILVAEDKLLDKGFRKEFNDIPNAQVEQLYKLFRRRPRWVKNQGKFLQNLSFVFGVDDSGKNENHRKKNICRKSTSLFLLDQNTKVKRATFPNRVR